MIAFDAGIGFPAEIFRRKAADATTGFSMVSERRHWTCGDNVRLGREFWLCLCATLPSGELEHGK
jgi:hypothetical protein